MLLNLLRHHLLNSLFNIFNFPFSQLSNQIHVFAHNFWTVGPFDLKSSLKPSQINFGSIHVSYVHICPFSQEELDSKRTHTHTHRHTPYSINIYGTRVGDPSIEPLRGSPARCPPSGYKGAIPVQTQMNWNRVEPVQDLWETARNPCATTAHPVRNPCATPAGSTRLPQIVNPSQIIFAPYKKFKNFHKKKGDFRSFFSIETLIESFWPARPEYFPFSIFSAFQSAPRFRS